MRRNIAAAAVPASTAAAVDLLKKSIQFELRERCQNFKGKSEASICFDQFLVREVQVLAHPQPSAADCTVLHAAMLR